jgi:hypothetical protein
MAGVTDENHELLLEFYDLSLDRKKAGEMRAICPGYFSQHPDLEQVEVLCRLRDIWEHINEEYQDCPDDIWDEFWDSLTEEIPQAPEQGLKALVHLPDEAKAAIEDPTSIWPLEMLGMTEAEILGEAFNQLAQRAKLKREELPPVPKNLDQPAMAFTDLVQACIDVQDWILSREAWARVLGRLKPLISDMLSHR